MFQYLKWDFFKSCSQIEGYRILKIWSLKPPWLSRISSLLGLATCIVLTLHITPNSRFGGKKVLIGLFFFLAWIGKKCKKLAELDLLSEINDPRITCSTPESFKVFLSTNWAVPKQNNQPPGKADSADTSASGCFTTCNAIQWIESTLGNLAICYSNVIQFQCYTILMCYTIPMSYNSNAKQNTIAM